MITSWLTKIILAGLAVGTIAYVGFCLFLRLNQRQFIFFPTPAVMTTPAAFGAAYTDVWIPVTTPAGAVGQLHGWWLPATTAIAGESPTTLLYLHGNGENIGANAAHAARLQRLGLSVLVFDYRGYGYSSPPFPSETQVYADAQAAWHYLTQDRSIPAAEIVIYGHSLGGAIAIELARHQPEAAALIVQSSFTSIQAIAADSGQYPGIPINWLLTQRFDSLSKIGQIQMPLLLIHGLADREVPAAMSQQLYNQAPDPKALWLVPIAAHDNVSLVAGEARYATVLRRFLTGELTGVVSPEG